MTKHEKLLVRIERLYAAIGATIGDEFKPLVEEDKETPGVFHIDLFGGESEAHAANLAHTAVYAVGNFFDHCKDFAKTSGIDTALVEKVTEQSLELRIVRDLYNADKHPEAKPNTSGVSPMLKDIRRWARMRPGSGGIGFGFRPDGRPFVTVGQSLSSIVDAEVVSSKTGKHVGTLENILGAGVSAWESFLAPHGFLKEEG